MKKALTIPVLIFSILLIVLIPGCGNGKNTSSAMPGGIAEAAGRRSLPGSVLEIRENMFINQINDVNLNYKDYLGTPIKLEGMLKILNWNENYYYYVIRYSPGCCGDDGEIGFEVTWDQAYEGSGGETDYGGYAEPNDWVEAQGELRSYDKFGHTFLYLALSELNVLEERGTEFVSR